jgi:poly(hydroxyalkanoate) granule-associated protein
MVAEKQKRAKRSSEEESECKTFFNVARKVLLAAVGASALAQEEIEDFVNRLIEKGEVAEKDGRQLIKELLERRKKRAERLEDVWEAGFERLLSAMNIPTKSDITELSKRVAELGKQIEQLKKSQ